MKILLILHFPLPHPGAAWARIEHFASFFARSGHQTHVSGSFSIKSLNRFGIRSSHGIRIFNLTPVVGVENTFSVFFNSISAFATSIVILACLRPDIVILSIPEGQTVLGSFIAAKILLRRKVIIDYRDEWEDFAILRSADQISRRSFSLLKRFATHCYRKSDLVVTVTDSLFGGLKKRNVINVSLVPNGADTTIFYPKSQRSNLRRRFKCKDSDFIIIYIGGIGGYYKLDIVIFALKRITPRFGIKLVMIGIGPDIDKIMALVRDLGLEKSVIHLCPITNKSELSSMIAASDIGIIPYDSNPLWKNSLPAKLFEYLACGLPVVATVFEDSEVARLLISYNVGLVSEPEKVDSLTSKIELLASNKSLYRELSRNAAVLIKTRFDRNVIAKQFLGQITST